MYLRSNFAIPEVALYLRSNFFIPEVVFFHADDYQGRARSSWQIFIFFHQNPISSS